MDRVLEQNEVRISELTAALEKERQRKGQQVQKGPGDVDQAAKIQSLTLALEEERLKASQRSAEAAALAQDKAELLAKNELALREMSELSRCHAAAIQDLSDQLERERRGSEKARLENARLVSEGQKIVSDNEQLQELVLGLQQGMQSSGETAERLQAENLRLAKHNELLLGDSDLASARLNEALDQQEKSVEVAALLLAENACLAQMNKQLVEDGDLALAHLNEALGRTTEMALEADQDAVEAERQASEAVDRTRASVETPQIQRSEMLALSEQLEQERRVSEQLRLSNADLAEANAALRVLGDRLSSEQLARFREREAEELRDLKLMMEKMEAVLASLPAVLKGDEAPTTPAGAVLPVPSEDSATTPTFMIASTAPLPQVSEDRASITRKKWDSLPQSLTAGPMPVPGPYKLPHKPPPRPTPKSKPQGNRKHG